jgi:Phasin protein
MRHLLQCTQTFNGEIMEIREQLMRARQRAEARVEDYRQAVLEAARRAAQQAADGVVAARAPIRIVADAGRRVNDASHRYLAQFVKQQLHNLEGVMEDGAERLSRAAHAKDFSGLIAEQAKLYPASRARLGRDLKATWTLTTDTGRELGSIASETYAQLIHGARTTRTTTSRKAPRRRKSARRSKVTKAN